MHTLYLCYVHVIIGLGFCSSYTSTIHWVKYVTVLYQYFTSTVKNCKPVKAVMSFYDHKSCHRSITVRVRTDECIMVRCCGQVVISDKYWWKCCISLLMCQWSVEKALQCWSVLAWGGSGWLDTFWCRTSWENHKTTCGTPSSGQ